MILFSEPSDPAVHSPTPQEGLDKWHGASRMYWKEEGICKVDEDKSEGLQEKAKGPAARTVFSGGARVLNAPVAVDQQDSLPDMMP